MTHIKTCEVTYSSWSGDITIQPEGNSSAPVVITNHTSSKYSDYIYSSTSDYIMPRVQGFASTWIKDYGFYGTKPPEYLDQLQGEPIVSKNEPQKLIAQIESISNHCCNIRNANGSLIGTVRLDSDHSKAELIRTIDNVVLITFKNMGDRWKVTYDSEAVPEAVLYFTTASVLELARARPAWLECATDIAGIALCLSLALVGLSSGNLHYAGAAMVGAAFFGALLYTAWNREECLQQCAS